MEKFFKWIVTPLVIILLGLAVLYFAYPFLEKYRLVEFVRFRQDPTSPEFTVVEELEQCPGAPFIVPTTGWIGVMYGDSIIGTQAHSGLDIFTTASNGVTPVYAAYDGYATRLPEWTSAVIIRHLEDPLDPGRQIWTYYTHMADTVGNDYIIDQIPRGTYELPIKQGMLLGYQGDYNGATPRQISTHLHFSIVADDGEGQFLDETDIAHTIDPSPYLGMRLNSTCADRPPSCRPDFACP